MQLTSSFLITIFTDIWLKFFYTKFISQCIERRDDDELGVSVRVRWSTLPASYELNKFKIISTFSVICEIFEILCWRDFFFLLSTKNKICKFPQNIWTHSCLCSSWSTEKIYAHRQPLSTSCNLLLPFHISLSNPHVNIKMREREKEKIWESEIVWERGWIYDTCMLKHQHAIIWHFKYCWCKHAQIHKHTHENINKCPIKWPKAIKFKSFRLLFPTTNLFCLCTHTHTHTAERQANFVCMVQIVYKNNICK